MRFSKQALLQWQPLFLVSALGLFFELAVVRWIAGEVRLFAYFKNVPLLAAFLGLAIGFALVGKGRDYRSAFAPRMAAFAGVVLLIGRTASPRALAYPGSGDEFLWGVANISYWLALALFVGVVLVFFLLILFLFIPLGQATGSEMARHGPVSAYAVNLLASLVGIWAFSVVSYLQTSPAVWFGLGLLGLWLYLRSRQLLSRLDSLVMPLTVVGLAVFGQGEIWSPYQRLVVEDRWATRAADCTEVRAGYTLIVQHVFYQDALDLSPGFVAAVPELQDYFVRYSLPYRFKPSAGRVLILGAGMGNDVAAALRNNADHVDAVEIDPAIQALGRELHPEHPYADPRVAAIVDDARAFLKRSADRYDVVAFGLLDSHTLLSGLSSVRLDSFVYTIESFEQVREHLADDGVAVLTFSVGAPWIEQRLGRMLVEVFGPDKVFVYQGAGTPVAANACRAPAASTASSETPDATSLFSQVSVTFVAGSIPPDKRAEARLAVWQPDPTASDLPLSVDDWPYLYLRTRAVPAAYWQVLLLIGAASLVLIARSFPGALRPIWHFWLLGAAFLLIEFKSITELALLFGTTWLVNALAISGVLLMALAANLIVLRRVRINVRVAYLLLFASLALAYVFPLDVLTGLTPVIRAVLSLILLSLPLLFAGLIFSESLRRAGETAKPLASNLSGSVAGGIIEYSSLWWGTKSLYVMAGLIYAAALLAFFRQRKR